jgi:putative tryptophan/tyrosine transport system substrate-binding protein
MTLAAKMQRFAKELVALQPDLILSHSTPTTAAMLRQTRTIPSFLRRLPIRSAAASSRASRGRAETSPVSS